MEEFASSSKNKRKVSGWNDALPPGGPCVIITNSRDQKKSTYREIDDLGVSVGHGHIEQRKEGDDELHDGDEGDESVKEGEARTGVC